MITDREGDSPTISRLVHDHRELEGVIDQARKSQRQIERRVDELRLASRPTFPTEEQRAGLAEAARRIGDRVVPESHHGVPIPTYGVVVDGSRCWLHIRHGAPYSTGPSGGKLWKFTDEEVEAFLTILKNEHAYRITDWWHSDGGLSVVVTS